MLSIRIDCSSHFMFTTTANTQIYTLSLHDALPICVLKEENEKEIRLITPEATYLTVAKKDVEARDTGKSAMPDDVIKHLSKSDRKSTRLNSSHLGISYAVFCLKKKKKKKQ